MELRIRNMLEKMDYDELLNLKARVDDGNLSFADLLKKTIQEKEKEHRKYCSVCGNDLDPNNTNNFTIMFGPEGFKKKASFCAFDCMEFFMTKLKQTKASVAEEQQKAEERLEH
jgi:hypothetical protein